MGFFENLKIDLNLSENFISRCLQFAKLFYNYKNSQVINNGDAGKEEKKYQEMIVSYFFKFKYENYLNLEFTR